MQTALSHSRELPKISVITITYNSVKFLEGCIRSVVEQNYPNLEYIIIDGGSTDGTVDIIKKYQKYIKYWISEPDQGGPDAYNKGVKVATGDIINFLNSDDLYAKNALVEVANKYQILPQDVDIIIGGVRIDFVESSKPSFFYVKKEYLANNLQNILFGNTYINGYFFRRKVVEEEQFIPLWNGSPFISNDTEFLIRLALKGIKSTFLTKVLYIYQSSQYSISFGGKNKIQQRIEWCSTAKYFLEKNQGDQVAAMLRDFYFKSLTSLILCYLAQYSFKKASAAFFAELKDHKALWLYKFPMSAILILRWKFLKFILNFSLLRRRNQNIDISPENI